MRISDRMDCRLWAARQWPALDRSCPACGSRRSTLVRRKAIVTALYQCEDCWLRFRVPKDEPARSEAFYQTQYQQGFTTDCPRVDQLAQLTQSQFRGTEKSYETYIKAAQAAGLQPGSIVYDFGCSWGYGSWQLAQAGYHVYSYEISRPRAQFAEERLGCRMLESPLQIPEPADCFFSAHVIEHLPDPSILWHTAAATLKPDGLVILFMPNGDPTYEQLRPDAYHRWWGKVHPLLIGASALQHMAQRLGFEGCAHSSPYDLEAIAQRAPGTFTGEELLFIARRRAGITEMGLKAPMARPLALPV